MVHSAPLCRNTLLISREANLTALKLKGRLAEARASKPFAGSGYDSDESLGLIARKTFYNDGVSTLSKGGSGCGCCFRANKITYRECESIENRKANILSMNDAIELAQKMQKVAADEIAYLKRSIIGVYAR